MPLQSLHLQELQLLNLRCFGVPRHREAEGAPVKEFKLKALLTGSALIAAMIAAPASAQSMQMPGMTMPMPKAKPKPNSAHSRPAKPTNKRMLAEQSAATSTAATVAQHAHPKEAAPAETPMATEPANPMDAQSADSHLAMSLPMPVSGHGEMKMTGALGRYPMERESSGTAWQPDTSRHQGLMNSSADWTLTAHGVLNLVYDHQAGPRGDDKVFASGMLMGMAQRPLRNGTLQLKAMVSPDALMGKSGYPLLLASGETANGHDRLTDRQHPHDFFMELSGSISQNFGKTGSVFLYAGLPGEPAFGPPAFMHREAILDSPEAPISHHWIDSTHISFGVVTAGVVLDRAKLEISRFNGREPDQHRWNIETGPLDSTAIRLSWNPTRTLALQGSWGRFIHPEQLEPGVNQTRWSASALWADEVGPGWKAAATLAWGRKSAHGHDDDALVAEASLKHRQWTVFGRGEFTENRELIEVGDDGPAYGVGKMSVGAVRDFRVAEHWSLGAGGLVSINVVPQALASAYGGHNPLGTMAFVRVKLD